VAKECRRHGDLQHGNIMVNQEGQLRLVDFDDIWIPELAGMAAPTEFGHRNYQYPGRKGTNGWGRWADTFSALVIYLSLAALGKDPGLLLPLYNKDNLLFEKADFYSPFLTQAWIKLAPLRDPDVNQLAGRLQECCAPTWVPDKSLEMMLEPRPARPTPAPSARRWWENEAATPAVEAPPSSWPSAMKSPPTAVLPAPPPLSPPHVQAGIAFFRPKGQAKLDARRRLGPVARFLPARPGGAPGAKRGRTTWRCGE